MYDKEKEIYQTIDDMWYKLYQIREDIGEFHPEHSTLSNLMMDVNDALCEFHTYLDTNTTNGGLEHGRNDYDSKEAV